MTASALRPEESRWARFARRHKLNVGLLFVLPAMLLYTLYVAWPVISTVQASFFDWDGDLARPCVHRAPELRRPVHARPGLPVEHRQQCPLVVHRRRVAPGRRLPDRLRAERSPPPAQPLSHRVLPADGGLARRGRVRLALYLQRERRAAQHAPARPRARRLHARLARGPTGDDLRGDGRRDLGEPGPLPRRLPRGHQLHPEGAVRERRHRWCERVAEACATSRTR